MNDEQVLKALEVQNLKLHSFKTDSEKGVSNLDFEEYIRSHIDSNIPVFAGGEVYIKNGNNKYELEGDHAVVVLGYKSTDTQSIEGFYIHDDRIGAYTKIESILLKQDGFIGALPSGSAYSIRVDGDTTVDEIFVVTTLKTATYYKVRIPYNLVLSACTYLREALVKVFSSYRLDDYGINFSMRLVCSSDLKSEYLKKNDVKEKSRVLLRSWPKFVWQCSFSIEEGFWLFDLVYDATDIPLGNGLVSVVRSNHSVVDTVISELHAVYANDEENIMDTSKVALSFFYSTIRKVINSKESFRQKLEDLFGKVNPPKTIKSNEVLDGDLVQNKEILEFIVNDQNKRLSDVVNGSNTHIWLISEDGVLVIGTDCSGQVNLATSLEQFNQ